VSGGRGEGLVAEARGWAAREHAGQERKANGIPYAEHVEHVAVILREAGFGEEVVAAALLHDIVEHTAIEPEQIRDRFGERVAELVAALTDREEIEDWSERKDEHRRRVAAAGRDALAIYAADKLAGIREARAGHAAEGALVEERLGKPLSLRLETWEADLEAVRRAEPPLPFEPQLAEQIEALRTEATST
jgi:(p)ppGpp synthase/HD superfamily hydrolase